MDNSGKVFVNANDFLLDSFRLARMVLDSNWQPEIMLALWRGGAPVGVAVHEFMAFHGIAMRQMIVRSASYCGIGQRGNVHLELSDELLSTINKGQQVLVVDDVFDSGNTAAAVMRRLEQTGANVRIATVYWKPSRNTTTITPHYHVHATNDWIVFPHELQGLSLAEIQEKSAALSTIIRGPAHNAVAAPAVQS